MNAQAPSQAALRRLARLVRDRKFRDASGQTVVEGPRALDGALACGAVLDAVFVRPASAERYLHGAAAHPDAARLGADVAQRIGRVDVAPAELLDEIADAKNPQGVLGVARFADTPLDDLVAAPRVVVLEALRNPGNAGAIVRSAVAAGFGAAVCTAGTTDIWSPKALRGAAGLTFGCAVSRGTTICDALDALGAAGHLRVRAAASGGIGVDEFSARLASMPASTPMTLLIGNEATGPSSDAVRGTDLAVSVPMRPPVDSLNAAVAASLLLYAMSRELRPTLASRDD